MPFSTPILRNFNEADAAPATGVTDLFGQSRIISNQLGANSNPTVMTFPALGTFGPSHLELYVDIAVKPADGGFVCLNLLQDAGSVATLDGYEARFTSQSGTDQWQLSRYNNGVFSAQLGPTVNLEGSAGDGLAIRITTGIGAQQVVSLWRRAGGVWACLVSAIDNTYTLGKTFSVTMGDTTARLDNLGGGAPTATNVSMSDAVSVWLMEEVSGSRADSKGSNTLSDNATVASSTDTKQGGRSADFERSSSEYLDITDAAQSGLDFTGAFSIALWTKLESIVAAPLSLVAKHQNSAGGHGYALQLNASQQVTGRVSGDGGSDTTVTSNLVLEVARWHHLALVYTGAALQVYIDGSLDNSVAYSSGVFNNSIAFTVGRSMGATDYYDGLIDELGAFNRALSEAEVLAIYAAGIQAPLPRGPIFPKRTLYQWRAR